MDLLSILSLPASSVGTRCAELLACLACDGELGRRIRAAVFGPEFAADVASVLAPIPVFVAIALAVRFWTPIRRARDGDRPRDERDDRP